MYQYREWTAVDDHVATYSVGYGVVLEARRSISNKTYMRLSVAKEHRDHSHFLVAPLTPLQDGTYIMDFKLSPPKLVPGGVMGCRVHMEELEGDKFKGLFADEGGPVMNTGRVRLDAFSEEHFTVVKKPLLQMTVAQLKDKLRHRGCPVTGLKPVLQERLRAAVVEEVVHNASVAHAGHVPAGPGGPAAPAATRNDEHNLGVFAASLPKPAAPGAVRGVPVQQYQQAVRHLTASVQQPAAPHRLAPPVGHSQSAAGHSGMPAAYTTALPARTSQRYAPTYAPNPAPPVGLVAGAALLHGNVTTLLTAPLLRAQGIVQPQHMQSRMQFLSNVALLPPDLQTLLCGYRVGSM